MGRVFQDIELGKEGLLKYVQKEHIKSYLVEVNYPNGKEYHIKHHYQTFDHGDTILFMVDCKHTQSVDKNGILKDNYITSGLKVVS